MANYQDELEKLVFSEREQEELTQRLIDRKSAEYNPRLRPSYRFVALAVVISMLVGAMGAVSIAGLSPQFRDFFGITQSAQEENLGALSVGRIFEDKNGSGASITVKEVVADREQLYILMEFAAPAAMALPMSDGERGYWIYGDQSPEFFADKSYTQLADVFGGYSAGSRSLTDDDATDNRIPLLYTVVADRGFSGEAQYCKIPNISTLWTAANGNSATVIDGMDITVELPMRSSTPSYSFAGRSSVNLGGTTLAVVENLAISSISISLDLIIPSDADYDAAFAQNGPWPVYVLLRDGTKVDAQYPEQAHGQLDEYRDKNGNLFFRADHAVLTLEHPIDVGEIQDIVFAGDNDPIDERPKQPSKIVYFFFTPANFYNSDYWNNINQFWMDTKD